MEKGPCALLAPGSSDGLCSRSYSARPSIAAAVTSLCWPCQTECWYLLCTLGAVARGETLSLEERTLWLSPRQPGLRLSPAHVNYSLCMSRAYQSIASVASLTVSLPRSCWTLGPCASSAGPAWGHPRFLPDPGCSLPSPPAATSLWAEVLWGQRLPWLAPCSQQCLLCWLEGMCKEPLSVSDVVWLCA